jgi:hypothetical protein
MHASSEPATSPIPRVIATAAEAEQAIAFFSGVMDELRSVAEEETALVRAGHVAKATRLEPRKAQLAGQFFASAERFKANAKFLTQALPERCGALKEQHAALQAVLQKNLVVLATAHAVAEGIMRRLSGEVVRRTTPQVYGAAGRTLAPSPQHARPLAVSRTL